MLAGRLLLPVSKDTFLRSIRAKTEKATVEPRVVSIDDWAWRKGQTLWHADLRSRTAEGHRSAARPRARYCGSLAPRAPRDQDCRPRSQRWLRRLPPHVPCQTQFKSRIVGICWRMEVPPSWPPCSGKAAIRGLSKAPADQPHGPPNGRRGCFHQTDRPPDRAEPRLGPPDHPRCARRCFPHPREQLDRLVASAGTGVERRMPQRRRTLRAGYRLSDFKAVSGASASGRHASAGPSKRCRPEQENRHLLEGLRGS